MSIISNRPLLSLTGVLLLAAILSGCASKNPLMSEPAAKPRAEAPVASDAPAKAAPQAPAVNEAKPAAVETPDPVPVAAPKPLAVDASAPKATPPAAIPPTPPKAAPAPASAAGAVLNTPPPSRTQRWLGIFTPYKQDIQQGNFISHEMASQIKEGQTREQVRFLLGVPLLTDMFHEGRWDYLFRLQKANGQVTTNRLTIFFKDNRVTRFESTQLPGEVEYISHISGSPPAPPKEAPKEAPKPAPEAKPDTKP